VRHPLTVHLRSEHGILEHEIFRNDAGFEDLAPAVNIPHEVVERIGTLLESCAQDIPFGRGEDAGQNIEWDEPLLCVRLPIDREGDADAPEQNLCLPPPEIEYVGWDLGEPAGQLAVGRPYRPVCAGHFIERNRHPLLRAGA